MQIQILGYLIIPLGIVLMFFNEKYLFYLTTFMMGFTGASIINIGDSLSIQPSYYLAILFMIREFIVALKSKKFIRPNMLLTVFIVICIISLIMPLLLSGKGITILNQDNKLIELKFTSHNITQLMYIIFCFTFYLFSKNFVKQKCNIETTIKVLISGAIFVCILGIYQEIAYLNGFEFDKIFRSSVHGNVQPYGSFVRIYSTALEPSMLAYYLVSILCLITCLEKNFIKYKYLSIVCILSVGVATVSSNFIIGIFTFGVFIVLSSLLNKREDNVAKKIVKPILIMLIISLIAVGVIYLINADIVKLFITSTIKKLTMQNVSSQERFSGLIQHLKVGIKHPLLGVGFGSARSKDLFSTWICNIGLIGTTIFIIYIIKLIKSLLRKQTTFCFGVASYMLVIFICMFVAVPEPYNLFIWLMLAVAEVLIETNNVKDIGENMKELKKKRNYKNPKILIINEKIIEGGTEQSCLKMKRLLEEHNIEVSYLTFDDKFEEKIDKVDNKNRIYNIKVTNNTLNKLTVNLKLYLKIRKKIASIKPDKIILNNLFSSPITQVLATRGYDVYQIVRDYSIVCPKSTCLKDDFCVCEGYKKEECYKNCKYHNSKIQLIFKLGLVNIMEILRKKVVKKFISPSEKLNEYLKNYGYNSVCINNPMEISNEALNDKKFNEQEKKKYIYIGMINENKGVYKFLDVFNEFSKDKDVELKVIGKCSSKEDVEIFDNYLKENEKVIFLGYKKHDEAIEEIKKSDFSIVPSLWIENYPTTALEGMLYGNVVLGSDRGGIPEIIGDDRGLLFNIMDSKNIADVLNKSYNMKKEEYEERISKSRKYVISNNSFDIYYDRIMKVLEE